MDKNIVYKIIKKKKLKEKERIELGKLDNKEYEDLKTTLKNIRTKTKEELENLRVGLITKPHLKLIGAETSSSPRIFTVKAGDSLELIANIEGGSGEYIVSWNINGKLSKEAWGKDYGGHIKQKISLIKIPTNDLQTIEDKEIIERIKNKDTNPSIGSHEIEVLVFDPNTKKSATDKLRLIITINKKKEREIEDFLMHLMGEKRKTKIEKVVERGKKIKQNVEKKKEEIVAWREEEKVKILSLKYNDKEYINNEIYLLPLDKTIELIGSKGRNIDKIIYKVDKRLDKNLEDTTSESNLIQTKLSGKNKLPSKRFEEGYYSFILEGYEKGKKPKEDPPISKDTKIVYLKGIPKLNTNLFIQIKNKKQIINFETGEKIDLNQLNKSKFDGLFFEVHLDESDEINNSIKVIIKHINSINTNKELHYDEQNKITYLKEGKFELNIKTEVKDIFGYIQEVILHKDLEIIDTSKVSEIEKRKILQDSYRNEIKPAVLDLNKGYEINNHNLKIIISTFEHGQQQYNEEKYKKMILDPAKKIINVEIEIEKGLDRLKFLIDSKNKEISEIYSPLNEFVEENKKANLELINLINEKLIKIKLNNLGQGLFELPYANTIPENLTNGIKIMIKFRKETIEMIKELDLEIERPDLSTLEKYTKMIRGIFRKT